MIKGTKTLKEIITFYVILLKIYVSIQGIK